MTLTMKYMEKKEEGRAEGRVEGMYDILYSLIRDGDISIEKSGGTS